MSLVKVGKYKVFINDWDGLRAHLPTALTLRALIELELSGTPATKKNIFQKIQKEAGLGPRSMTVVHRSLQKLVKKGYIYNKVNGNIPTPKKIGRGGRIAPYSSIYVEDIQI